MSRRPHSTRRHSCVRVRPVKRISMRVTWPEWWTWWRARREGNRHMRAVYAERAALEARRA